ncbi:hypothetical protein FEE95_21330 [Maribacter algarum]|uniref:ADP-ribosylglycohydrolase n=1 Tax=Maribacter algarum (ex Zhang et al. 2020) TaxID=2578118 RepID=A0A5S3Q5H4_9FLAO|nr:ADP-ribosylglycohydrolase family protein [Maribacter algarum]TMM51962.1 hypothetical protein FEE95_21330 [Maribacter algarum]
MKTIKDGILGLAIGDAIGVPVEFQSRVMLDKSPVTDMQGFGTHHQPPGTWSDDSSLTFCLADSLCDGFDLADIAKQFIAWKLNAKWTAHDEVFDIGIQTMKAINQLIQINQDKDWESLKYLRYEVDEFTNGNGSLMRILPLYHVLKGEGVEKGFEIIWEVSALTHGHIRAAISCLIYLVLVDELMEEREKATAYFNTRTRINKFFQEREIVTSETQQFDRIITNNIQDLDRNEIKSSGYVVDSLEASLWCFLKSESYKDCILKAVNLGEDTDTTAAITGGLAGIYYGYESFPENWLDGLVMTKQIEELANRLEEKWK